ncbi:hypothetical protein CSUI_011080 [Cystoisospora suis]|uniref:Uncharacterized protein n=1 Tax=Cystoisospora suis TaxID=483139 RepID=A0A2C6KEN6_9APIC|nr:hypothetical protein CSUI_011080 [Cystoisospora suis]
MALPRRRLTSATKKKDSRGPELFFIFVPTVPFRAAIVLYRQAAMRTSPTSGRAAQLFVPRDVGSRNAWPHDVDSIGGAPTFLKAC